MPAYALPEPFKDPSPLSDDSSLNTEELLQRRKKIYRELGVDFDNAETITLYALLGLSRDIDDSKVISKAYRKQAKTLLSKKARKDRPVVDAIQEEIEYAFAVLKDDAKRHRYDGYLSLLDRHAELLRISGAAQIMAKDGQCPRSHYEALRNHCRDKQIKTKDGKNWLDDYFETQSIKIVDDPSPKAPPPPKAPAPKAEDSLKTLMAFCQNQGRIEFRDTQKLLKHALELKIKDPKAALLGLSRANKWTIEWQEPAPKPAARPTPMTPRNGGPREAATRDAGSREAKPRHANSRSLERPKALSPRAARSESRTSLPAPPKPAPPKPRRDSTPKAKSPSTRLRGRTLLAPPTADLSASRDQARDRGRNSKRRDSSPGTDHPVASVYLSVLRKVQRAVRNHSELKEYIPPFNNGDDISPPYEGRSHEDILKEQSLHLQAALRLLSQLTDRAGELDQEGNRHVQALIDQLSDQLTKARQLDESTQHRAPDQQIRVWRRYVSSKLSSQLADNAPPSLLGSKPISRRVRRPSTGRLSASSGRLASARRPTPSSERNSRSNVKRRKLGDVEAAPSERNSRPLRRPSTGRPVGRRRPSREIIERKARVDTVHSLPSRQQRLLAGVELSRNCSLSVFDASGQPLLVPNTSGEISTPSTLLFNEYSLLVGRSAREAVPDRPEHRVDDFLYYLGEERWFHRAYQREYPAETLVSLVLMRLLRDVLAQSGEPVTDVVISVPSVLTPRQRGALYIAGELAGVNVLDVIESSTAVTMARMEETLEDAPGLNLTLHIGDESLDCTLWEKTVSGLVIRDAFGDERYGKLAWNQTLADEIAELFMDLEGLDPRQDPISGFELNHKAWDLVKDIGSHDPARVLIECQDRIQMITVDRNRFDMLIEPLLVGGLELVHSVLRQYQLAPNKIHSLTISGDPHVLPFIRESFQDLFPSRILRTDGARDRVASGALSWGSRLLWRASHEGDPLLTEITDQEYNQLIPQASQRQFDQYSLQRSTAESLGVLTETTAGPKKLTLLPVGSLLPRTVKRKVGVTGPGFVTGGVLPRQGQEISLVILGGDSDDPSQCEVLAELFVSDPNAIRDQLEIELRFLDQDGRFIIDIVDPINKELLLSQQISSDQRKGFMDPESLENWQQDLQLLSDEGPSALR